METPHGHGKKGIKRFLYTTALVAVLLSGKSYKEGGWEQLGEDRKKRYEMTIGKGVSWITSLFQHEPGKFFDKKISPDGQYSIYTYILKYGGTSGAVKKQANDQGIGKAVKIFDENGEDITDSKKKLEPGKRVTVYVKNLDAEDETIEGIRITGDYATIIDISRFNNALKKEKPTLAEVQKHRANNRKTWYEKFKNYNLQHTTSSERVSGVYIRLGDGAAALPEIDEFVLKYYLDFFTKYNNDKEVTNAQNQLALGVYWRLSLNPNTTGESEANAFLKRYNTIKKQLGNNPLVIMLDLEEKDFRRNKNELKTRAIARLNTIEKATGMIPQLYIGASPFGDYVFHDKRFKKYTKYPRITCYANTDKHNKEKGISYRFDTKTNIVKVGNNQPKDSILPLMTQYTQQGNIPGMRNSEGHTDKSRISKSQFGHVFARNQLGSK